MARSSAEVEEAIESAGAEADFMKKRHAAEIQRLRDTTAASMTKLEEDARSAVKEAARAHAADVEVRLCTHDVWLRRTAHVVAHTPPYASCVSHQRLEAKVAELNDAVKAANQEREVATAAKERERGEHAAELAKVVAATKTRVSDLQATMEAEADHAAREHAAQVSKLEAAIGELKVTIKQRDADIDAQKVAAAAEATSLKDAFRAETLRLKRLVEAHKTEAARLSEVIEEQEDRLSFVTRQREEEAKYLEQQKRRAVERIQKEHEARAASLKDHMQATLSAVKAKYKHKLKQYEQLAEAAHVQQRLAWERSAAAANTAAAASSGTHLASAGYSGRLSDLSDGGAYPPRHGGSSVDDVVAATLAAVPPLPGSAPSQRHGGRGNPPLASRPMRRTASAMPSLHGSSSTGSPPLGPSGDGPDFAATAPAGGVGVDAGAGGRGGSARRRRSIDDLFDEPAFRLPPAVAFAASPSGQDGVESTHDRVALPPAHGRATAAGSALDAARQQRGVGGAGALPVGSGTGKKKRKAGSSKKGKKGGRQGKTRGNRGSSEGGGAMHELGMTASMMSDDTQASSAIE